MNVKVDLQKTDLCTDYCFIFVLKEYLALNFFSCFVYIATRDDPRHVQGRVLEHHPKMVAGRLFLL